MFTPFIICVIIIGRCLGQDDPSSYSILKISDDGRYVVYEKANFYMVDEVCRMNNLRVVKIDSDDKNKEVTSFIQTLPDTGNYWLGINKLFRGTNWSFGLKEPVTYFNWNTGKPQTSGGNKRCAELDRSGYWNDIGCEQECFILCEV